MHLLWFRRDLRLTDNEIVTLASANNAAVLPFFIIDPSSLAYPLVTSFFTILKPLFYKYLEH